MAELPEGAGGQLMPEPLLPASTARVPDLTVVIPTAWRAGRVMTDKMLDPADFVVLCPEDQLEAYRAEQPHLQYHPYPLPEGNISRKWGYIYDTFGDVLILDDDVDRFVHLEHKAGEPPHNLAPDEALSVMQRTAWEASQAGCYLFGFGNGSGDVRNYDALHPMKVKGMAYTIGLLAGSKITFTDEIIGVVDYWMVLMNAFHHRKAFIDQRYEPTGPPLTFSNPGGMAMVRTMGSEENDFRALRRWFGDAIKLKGDTGRAKHKFTWQRSIELPF